MLLVVEGRVRIIWGNKIREKLADKHGVTDKDVYDVYERWETLKSVELDKRTWRYVIEGNNSIGEWMRAVVAIETEPEMIAIPISCYRCVKPRKK